MSNYDVSNLIQVTPEPNQLAVRVGGIVFMVARPGDADVSDTTATAADVLAGKEFRLANGSKATGTIQSSTPFRSGNVVTVPSGYIATEQTLTVPEAEAVTVNGNEVSIPVGYIASVRTVTVGTTKAAQTYTPTTSDQTIASGQYLAGDQTIKGDANLLAANIVSGVTIFGVTGTASGGATDFYKCATVSPNTDYIVSGAGTAAVNGRYRETAARWKNSPVYSNTNYYMVHDVEYDTWFILDYIPGESDNPLPSCLYYKEHLSEQWYIQEGGNPAPTVTKGGTWTGYKAVQDPVTGAWGYASTVTSNLTYSEVTPVIGKVYADGALIEANLWSGIPTSGLVFHASLAASSATAETGQTLTANNVSFDVIDGIPCAVFAGNEYSYIYTADGTNLPVSDATSTLSCWVRFNTLGAYNSWFMAYGSGSTNALRGFFSSANDNYAASGIWGSDGDNVSGNLIEIDTWYHFAAIFTSSGQQLYLNGQLISTHSYGGMDTVFEKLSLGGYFGAGSSSLMEYADCCVAAARVYNRALSAAEIATLAAEFTPSAQ